MATATPDERPTLERTLNILVLGSDRRPNTPNWRTDVMMIVALDLESGQAGVISIPRDVYIDSIPNHQPNRVNVIDYLGERDEPDGGGPALLKQIILERMDIRIDHFLRFDFSSFQEVVDALGGVDIEIDCPYYDYFSIEDVILNIQPGLVHMSGAEALVYVRSRRLGGDLDRARRQQRFVWAVRNHVLEKNLLPRVPALYQALDDSIQTDIGIINAIRIVRFALDLDETDIHGFVVAPPTMLTSGWRSGMSVFIPDWPAIRTAAETLFSSAPFLDTNTPTRCP
jgi:LCP family protein required for cell wall assembly